jgi:hypothetical protein
MTAFPKALRLLWVGKSQSPIGIHRLKAAVGIALSNVTVASDSAIPPPAPHPA